MKCLFITALLSLVSEMLEHYGFAHLRGWLAGARRHCENLFCFSRLFYAQPLLDPNPQENRFILKLKTLLSLSSSLPLCICVWQCSRARDRETHTEKERILKLFSWNLHCLYVFTKDLPRWTWTCFLQFPEWVSNHGLFPSFAWRTTLTPPWAVMRSDYHRRRWVTPISRTPPALSTARRGRLATARRCRNPTPAPGDFSRAGESIGLAGLWENPEMVPSPCTCHGQAWAMSPETNLGTK